MSIINNLSPKTCENSERLVRAISRITDAIAKLFCPFIQGTVVVDIMRRSVLKYAYKEILESRSSDEKNKKITLTELALKSGLDTRTIRKYSEVPLRAMQEYISAEAALLNHWAKDPKLRNPVSGKPMDLPIRGADGSFEGLVMRYMGRGVSPKFIVEHLEKHGCVEAYNKNWVRLVDPKWQIIEEKERDILDYGSRSLVGLVAAVDHNLRHRQTPEAKWLERRVYSLHIPQNLANEARSALNELLKKQQEEISLCIRSFERHNEGESAGFIGTGIYYWEEAGIVSDQQGTERTAHLKQI